jgi:hypothetical protein
MYVDPGSFGSFSQIGYLALMSVAGIFTGVFRRSFGWIRRLLRRRQELPSSE